MFLNVIFDGTRVYFKSRPKNVLKHQPPIVVSSLVKCVSCDNVGHDVEGQHQNIEYKELQQKQKMMELWLLHKRGKI